MIETVIGFAIELLVAVLLAATIFYCAVLDRRLKRLRNDETSMRGTITELVGATHAAERAIQALRATVAQSEETLADRLGRAEQVSTQMAGQLGEGEEVIARIARIAKAARDHGERVGARAEIERIEAEREQARIDARIAAEREFEERLPASVRRAPEPEPVSRSAATAAAAELFANRIRALSLGSAS
ncbi:DUF6468 domain-containing protein [Methylopila sp. M107]|uniref:DUF6468 domain-containing protein n=1 Tax=Methylopila sp. M107 TaxID=1101190 RepID=UPI00037E1B41|nr:DUF6468 domain-containing protein [Methylopila sp. M107]